MSYHPRRSYRSAQLTIQGLRHQLYCWEGWGTPIVFLHGWGDSGLTFQFLIDGMQLDRACVALDWRGFGRSERPQGTYWFPDYLADLDAFLCEISPDEPVDIVGHSMGANVAMLYAGARPERVRRLVNLEGFGLSVSEAKGAPARYRKWLDQLRRGTPSFTTHVSFERFEGFLAKRNPRTPHDRIAFIAHAWAEADANGAVVLRADPRHRWVNPILYRREEAEACWREITARVLLVLGDQWWSRSKTAAAEFEAVYRQLRHAHVEVVPGAGHMLHHEQPEKIAQLIDRFLTPA